MEGRNQMILGNFKKLFIDGVEMKELYADGVRIWNSITFTNQVPISTDTDGSIFNGTGYIENRRLSSSGGLSGSAQNGSVTTGFIPFPDGDKTVIRMKGVEWMNATNNYNGHFYIMFYNANKKSQGANDYMWSGHSLSHIYTVTRDANGVETIVFNKDYGTSNAFLQWVRSASYIRITAYGKGANMVVTINEEIEL
jgi:hypothetical protein